MTRRKHRCWHLVALISQYCHSHSHHGSSWHLPLSDMQLSVNYDILSKYQIISLLPPSCHASCRDVEVSYVSLCAAGLACQLPCQRLWYHISCCSLSFSSRPDSSGLWLQRQITPRLHSFLLAQQDRYRVSFKINIYWGLHHRINS